MGGEMAKKLMKGCEAIGEAAIRAGCKHFFGYPITPQTEVPEYLSRRLPEVGGVYVQAESEVAASNMIYGAAGTGTRVFTSSSSPGISLMSEGLSYIAGAELPVVLINIVRAGPGLGGILPAQSDYFQATKGGGHGDFRIITLAPCSVQEAADLVMDAFDLADKYRNPVMVMGDGMIGQMMEPVEFKERPSVELPPKDWATTGARGREPNVITSLYLDPKVLYELNVRLKEKYERIQREEVRWETINCDKPYDLLVVSYGTMSRICHSAVTALERKGVNVGIFRPITLWPFPYEQLREAASSASMVVSVEMSMGQMVEDVKLAVEGRIPVRYYGTAGGIVPNPADVRRKLEELLAEIESR